MSAKILYIKAGTDPTTGLWPSAGPPYERWNFTSGTAVVIQDLIGYGDGSVTFADGRAFQIVTPQGSTLKHQKG